MNRQVKCLSDEAANELADQRKENRLKEQNKMLGHAGVPARFINKRFSGYVAKTKEQQFALTETRNYAKSYQQAEIDGVNMVLTGSPGTGKTHLAISILLHVMQKGKSGIFTSVSELLRTIRMTYSKNSEVSEQDAFDMFINPDFLIIDEIGVAIGDEEKRKSMVFDIINARYNAMRPTIIIGNLTPDEMREYLGLRVWDIMREGGGPIIPFTWRSHR